MRNYLLLAIPLFFFGCALQLPPGGGEIDSIAPEIVYTYPENGTMNFKDDYLQFEFSEYVDKSKFKEALFISPAIDGVPEISWTNTTVTVTFPEKLKDSITYTVSVGTDVMDLHNNNRMASSFSLKFSTWDRLDNGSIQGTIYQDKPSGTMLFAYRKDRVENGIDSLKPDYITQAGENGTFRFEGIGPGQYRVFAVSDEFKDFLFQPDQDEIGIPSKDCNITLQDTLVSGISYRMQKMDTVYPRLLTAVMTDRKHALLTFSESLKFGQLTATSFSISDSTSAYTVMPLGVFKGRTKEKELVVIIPDSLPNTQSLYISIKNFGDEFGNVTIKDSASLVYSDKPDTLTPSIIQFTPQKGASDVNFQSLECSIKFDDFVNASASSFQLRDTLKNVIKTKLIKNDDAWFTIIPTERIKPFTYYDAIVDVKSLSDASGNTKDTVIINRFKTMNDIDFTGVYGSVVNWDSTQRAIVRFVNKTDTAISYQTVLGKSGVFGLKNMLPGKYTVMFFYDANNNGHWDRGSLQPFVFSESGVIFSEELGLTARWSVTDYVLDFSKPIKIADAKDEGTR